MASNSGSLISMLDSIDGNSFTDETERSAAMNAAAALQSRLEQPWETALKYSWMVPALMAGLKIVFDLDLFKKWKDSGRETASSDMLADMTGANQSLLSRLLKHIASMHLLEQIGEDSYKMRPFTQALAEPGVGGAVPFYFGVNGPGFLHLPSFCASTNYQDPRQSSLTSWSQMLGSGETFFGYLNKNPELLRQFQLFLASVNKRKDPWTALFPVQQLVAEAKPDRPLVVDVGGGQGSDLCLLADEYPDLPAGSLVLQEQASVIAQLSVKPPIEVMVHDFFTEQPIKGRTDKSRGATMYFLKTVLHDWPDDKACVILKNLAAAMDKDYSRIVLHEFIMTPFRPAARMTSNDLTMMMIFGSAERTEQMWRDLVSSAGLQVVKIWEKPGALGSLLELKLA